MARPAGRGVGHQSFSVAPAQPRAGLVARLRARLVTRPDSEHEQAIEHHELALRLARETGNRFPEALALLGLATAHRHLGHADEAASHASQALSIARQYQYGAVAARARETLPINHP